VINLKIFISQDAVKWFQEEMEVSTGDTIRFYARYGGSSPIQQGFSLGMTKDTPFEPVVTVKVGEVLFFIEEVDEWYFDRHDLYVHVDHELDELAYTYKKSVI